MLVFSCTSKHLKMMKLNYFRGIILMTSCVKTGTKLPGRLYTKSFSTSFTRHVNHRTYDVVISGGGMVGAAMAAALGYSNCFKDKHILLLEGAPEKDYSILPSDFSNRVVAISPSTVDLFESFGAWEKIQNMRYQPVKKMQVWDSCTDSLITFDKDNLNSNLAYIVENDTIMAGLTAVLSEVQDRIEVRYGSRVRKYNLPNSSQSQSETEKCYLTEIELDDGNTVSARLVIGADGFKSLLRQSAEIQTVEWNYDQMAVVSVLHLAEETENNVAWQRFLKTGPIAMLPLSSDFSCLIWTTSVSDAQNLLQLPEESFVDAVNQSFWSEQYKDPTAGSVLQAFDSLLASLGLGSRSQHQLPPQVMNIVENSRAMFPLGLCHAIQYCKYRVALIGDAAHRVHPLAGQGVNLGFGDVACLRDKLEEAVSIGSDIGSLNHLLEYETERQRHVVPVMATIDGLNRLYSTSWTPLVLLRSLGLTATDALGPVKEQFMKGAT